MKWVFVAGALFVAGLIFNLPVMSFAALAGLVIFGVTRWLTRQWTTQISGDRKWTHDSVEIGTLANVTVRIRNQGQLPISWMLVEDLVPEDQPRSVRPRLKVHGARIDVVKLRPGESKQWIYQVEPLVRGLYQLGPIIAETGDYYGWHRAYRILGQPNYLLVYPKAIRIEDYDIQSRRPIGEVVMTHRLFEDPTRISGVRDYQPGDPLSRVHWRATARTGVLQSKQFQPSSMSGATIVLDFHRDAFDPQHEPYRSELAITTAASIAHALDEMGQQFGLISNGLDAAERIRVEGWVGDPRSRESARQITDMKSSLDRKKPLVVPTRKGPDQIQQVREMLARTELNVGLPLADLIAETAQRMPADASVIVVLALPSLETAIALRMLRRQGRAVTAIVNSHDEAHYARAAGVLQNEGITTHQLLDENSIATICRSQKLPR